MFQQTGESAGFGLIQRFFENNNEHWLLPYAAFSYLRDLYGTPDFSQWPEHTEDKAEEMQPYAQLQSSVTKKLPFTTTKLPFTYPIT